jgi:hypothetical protein
MFERFLNSFVVDSVPEPTRDWAPRGVTASGFGELMSEYAGCTFEKGLYRLHTAESAALGDRLAAEAFPEFAGRARCFGLDWLGRQFALDSARQEANEPLVLMFEPGTGQVLEIPGNFVDFHDRELVDYANEALAREFFDEWAAANPSSLPLSLTDCVGYKVPLFLGGEDRIENLEVIDLDVYWTIHGQLLRRIRGLPPGTTIGEISIGD